MKFISRSRSAVTHASVIWHDSTSVPGVRYAVRRVSVLGRIELIARVRELLQRYEFLKAGNAADQLEANLAELVVRKTYLEWGLCELRNLSIDGETATVNLLIDKGPEALSDEIVSSVRAQLDLTEDERKNS